MTPVCGGTAASVHPLQSDVSTNISVPTAVNLTMSIMPAPTNPKQAQTVDNVARPIKRPRTLYWEWKVEGISRLTLISEYLLPLPCVPDDELQNEIMTRTIPENEHLFRIVSPHKGFPFLFRLGSTRFPQQFLQLPRNGHMTQLDDLFLLIPSNSMA